MIRMIVFDMAGTTVNEDNLVYKAVRQAVNEQGFDFTLNEVLEVAAGQEKLQAIKSVLKLQGINDESLAATIFEQFKILLDKAYNEQSVTEQPNTLNVLQLLMANNILVVLNTGYSRAVAEKLLHKLNWKEGKDFDALVTASDVTEARPKPDMILYAMKRFGLSNSADVVKVGDSIIDILEGQNAGCKLSIGITTGAHTYAQLQTANPDYIIHNLLDLLPILEVAPESHNV